MKHITERSSYVLLRSTVSWLRRETSPATLLTSPCSDSTTHHHRGYHDTTQVAPDPAKPTTVPGRPTSVSVEVYDAQSLKVVFSPPADDGGDTGSGFGDRLS